jgi:uncharacterized protein YjeT (DUF2065 family)
MILGIVCIIAGFFIAFDFFIQWEPRLEKIQSFIDKYARYVGMVAMFVGLWKFFGPDATATATGYAVEGVGPKIIYDAQPFIGDLFPALFLFLGGFSLFPQIFEFFNMKEDLKEKFISTLSRFKLALGLGNILLGIIHLLIPGTTLF